MTITRLALTDFRNHADIVLQPGSGLNVLTGENGAGKTNILEALSLLVPGRGLRGAGLGLLARQGGPGGFGISARLGDVDLGTGALASAPERRLVRINGAATAANALSEWLAMIWLTPAMDRLFTDSASERRRFLDRLVLALEPSHARHSARYEAAMRQRNRLLSGEETPDPQWLTALERQMAEHGAPIAQARLRLIEALNIAIQSREDGPFARATLTLDGWTAAHDLAPELLRSRTRDMAAGRTLAGPHRTDLSVTHAGKGMAAAQCSTGEQKALLLGIVLAHAWLVADQRGAPPILLLDEVAAHLDPDRRAILFARLDETGGQVWMTGTEPGLFDSIPGPATRFRLVNGVISSS